MPGIEFSEALLFAPDKVGQDGGESASCRTLRFIREQTFEMTAPRGSRASAFDEMAMRNTLVIYAGGRPRGALYGVRKSENEPTKADVWWGTFNSAELYLGNPLFRWHQDKFKGNMEAAARDVGIPLERYTMLVNGNVTPTPGDIDALAARTTIPRRDLEQWASHQRGS